MDSPNRSLKCGFANDYQVWREMINSMVAFVSASANLVNNLTNNLQNIHPNETLERENSIEYFPIDFPCYLNMLKKMCAKINTNENKERKRTKIPKHLSKSFEKNCNVNTAKLNNVKSDIVPHGHKSCVLETNYSFNKLNQGHKKVNNVIKNNKINQSVSKCTFNDVKILNHEQKPTTSKQEQTKLETELKFLKNTIKNSCEKINSLSNRHSLPTKYGNCPSMSSNKKVPTCLNRKKQFVKSDNVSLMNELKKNKSCTTNKVQCDNEKVKSEIFVPSNRPNTVANVDRITSDLKKTVLQLKRTQSSCYGKILTKNVIHAGREMCRNLPLNTYRN